MQSVGRSKWESYSSGFSSPASVFRYGSSFIACRWTCEQSITRSSKNAGAYRDPEAKSLEKKSSAAGFRSLMSVGEWEKVVGSQHTNDSYRCPGQRMYIYIEKSWLHECEIGRRALMAGIAKCTTHPSRVTRTATTVTNVPNKEIYLCQHRRWLRHSQEQHASWWSTVD